MMMELVTTGAFRKDYKRAKKRGLGPCKKNCVNG